MAEPARKQPEELGVYFFSTHQAKWERPASGPGEVVRLFTDPDDNMETRLVRFPARSTTGGAPGLLGREVYVVSGEFDADGEHLEEGDFHRGVGASVSGGTESGCVLFTLREGKPSAGTGDAPDAGTHATALTILAPDGDWDDVGDGMRWKRLTADLENRFEILLVEMEGDAEFPAHRHEAPEEVLVLRGECDFHGRRLGPGDYIRSEAGTEHQPIATDVGCAMILVRRIPAVDSRRVP